MKLKRLFLLLSCSVFCVSLQSVQGHSEEGLKICVEGFTAGTLENGMHFAVQQSEHLDHALFLTLRSSVPYNNNSKFLFYLMEHALFNGTASIQRATIQQTLADLSLDINIDNAIVYNEHEQALRFSLCNTTPLRVLKFLTLLKHIINSEQLTQEGIELARNHLFATLPLSFDEQLRLQSVTVADVQEAHKKWFHASKLFLLVSGVSDEKEFVSFLSELFGPVVKNHADFTIQSLTDEAPKDDTAEELKFGYPASYNLVKMENSHDGTCLIDGKIRMNQPKGLEKKSNGTALGVLMVIIGIGSGLMATFATVSTMGIPLLLGVVSVASFGSGVYLSVASYLNDPYYIARLRSEDLINGSAYAYKRGYIQYALTPYERRVMMIKELLSTDMSVPVQSLPISLLTKVYHLTDPVIRELFTTDEYTVLMQLKNEVIDQGNLYQKYFKDLEAELVNATTPYSILRDLQITAAKSVYDNSYPVVCDNMLKKEYKQLKEELHALREKVRPKPADAPPPGYNQDAPSSYTASHSSYSKHGFNESPPPAYEEVEAPRDLPPSYSEACATKEALLLQKIKEVKANMQANEVALDLVKVTYELEVTKAEQEYTSRVEMCKQQIDYYSRKVQYSINVKEIIYHYNRQLQAILLQFPANPLGLPDYIDRTQ